MWRRALPLLLLALTACAADPPAEPTPAPVTAAPALTASPTAPPDPFALAAGLDSATPAELAARLTEAEAAIRSSGTAPDVASAARVQQAAYRQLVRTPEWRAEALAAMPGELQDVVRANVEAGAELRALTSPRTELPPWRIEAPPPPDELRAHYESAERESGIGWEYLAAIHLVETRMGRIRGTSTAGARGPMQFLPSTWERWGEGDIEDHADSIRAAARYLRGHGGPDDMPRALFAYNRSDRYVRAITLYAGVMESDPSSYAGYYHWDVYYRTTGGDALLYVGWPD